MARTALTVTTLEGAFGDYGANEADITMAAADVANGNSIDGLKEGDIVIAYNSDVGAQTVTFTSVADPSTGRTGDITAYSIGASEYAAFGPFKSRGWRQSDGDLYIDASDAGVLLGVLRQA